jgi:hypothetical protein
LNRKDRIKLQLEGFSISLKIMLHESTKSHLSYITPYLFTQSGQGSVPLSTVEEIAGLLKWMVHLILISFYVIVTNSKEFSYYPLPQLFTSPKLCYRAETIFNLR